MALQPAAGARDLNPREVEQNRAICATLAGVYRLWGYQAVAPPSFERLDTLQAGGAIDGRELVRLAADEPLGLRPELTASIARAACTRMAERPRPLRLWAEGTTFRSSTGDSGNQRIHEQWQSGVELLGERSAAADVELMRLLLAAAARLGLGFQHRPRLLVGHQGLLTALLAEVPEQQRGAVRAALTGFDALALAQLPLSDLLRQRLSAVMRLRGEPPEVLYALEQWLGPVPLLSELAATLAAVAPAASRQQVALRLDPSFQPHFALYDGLVLKLVCQGANGPVEIASGGRYDALVGRFGADPGQAAGVGFGFDVEAVRELAGLPADAASATQPVLVGYSGEQALAAALDALETFHRQGQCAELLGHPVPSQAEADRLAGERGCCRATWIAA
ncbi:ATP phosphoribosyltransferase regulatory subunit [Cyanobium sp. ATX 6A2]|uniref:ATP phosphoribosyltransferase regulatory subunit n=1 Tax=Cyanobium sp. ATX 6A2 TaxID=2823700 RepID=UPI0020CF6108|nr:ATP phosphoribosyltransferase regulatory subunit [Cyanobium sp. ATX 6A2]MCP9887282.1 ATP phosphoribosyltransferase regulatory subunit [Cyanobium sp. ATX 6A2]